jgi:hypothetical protein
MKQSYFTPNNNRLLHDNRRLIHGNRHLLHDKRRLLHDHRRLLHENNRLLYGHCRLLHDNHFEMSVLCVRAGVNERFVFEECQVPSMENKSRSSL